MSTRCLRPWPTLAAGCCSTVCIRRTGRRWDSVCEHLDMRPSSRDEAPQTAGTGDAGCPDLARPREAALSQPLCRFTRLPNAGPKSTSGAVFASSRNSNEDWKEKPMASSRFALCDLHPHDAREVVAGAARTGIHASILAGNVAGMRMENRRVVAPDCYPTGASATLAKSSKSSRNASSCCPGATNSYRRCARKVFRV